MDDLVVRLRIEEDNRGYDKKGAHTSIEVKKTLWNLVKVPRQKSTTKGRALS